LIKTVIKGFLNGNGSPDLGDAIVALQVCAGLVPGTNLYPASAGADGRIGLREARFILEQVGRLR